MFHVKQFIPRCCKYFRETFGKFSVKQVNIDNIQTNEGLYIVPIEKSNFTIKYYGYPERIML